MDKTDCWPEASGSAMFAYAMIMEVKKGWLDAAEYGLVHGRYGNFFVKRSVLGSKRQASFLWSFLKYSQEFFCAWN